MNTVLRYIGLPWLVLALWMQPAFAEVSEPERLIRETSNLVLAEIKTRQQEFRDDPAKLTAMVDEKVLQHFDFSRMTALALGRYKRKVTAEQKPRVIAAFRELLVRTYGKALLEYNDQKIVFLPMRGNIDKGQVTVRTEIEQPGGFPIPLSYDMYLKEGQWKVYDITVDKISLVTNYRSSFARTIKQSGIDGLIESLTQRNQESS